jgi:hypothetical protein
MTGLNPENRHLGQVEYQKQVMGIEKVAHPLFPLDPPFAAGCCYPCTLCSSLFSKVSLDLLAIFFKYCNKEHHLYSGGCPAVL